MTPFLKLVAQDIYTKYGDEMQNICIMFPNRRSILFFNKYLSQEVKKVSWAPQCTTISDYVQSQSDLQLADGLLLLFDLYQVYCQVFNSSETFESFYYWGELLLSDFNDIDKYLIDASDLFKNLTAFKNINEQFSYLDENQLDAIKQFWKNFGQSRQSDQHQQFSYNWSLMHSLYKQFREKISEKKMAYEGMQYRHIAGLIQNNSFVEPSSKKIAIVGFNALSECEKVLFRYLTNLEKALFYWDYNEEIIQQTNHEAGFFIRQNLTEFPSSLEKKHFVNHDLPEKIEVIAVPSLVGQAKVAGQIIEQNFLNSEEIENTAIMLADESLLMPVLRSIPPEIQDINITMGYPLKNAPIVTLIESMGLLYLNARKNLENQVSHYYYKNVFSILNHPYVAKEINEEIAIKKIEFLSKNIIFIEPSRFPENEFFNLVFQPASSGIEFIEKLAAITKLIGHKTFGNQPSIEENPAGIESETLVLIYTTLNRFSDLLMKSGLKFDIPLCFQLLMKIVNGLTLPFEGEPLKGLQVMGLLESRAIDFDNIILLNVNEGYFPKTNVPPSFIPYNLRRGFGLPTIEYRDAIYAYYFYRIIQRVKNIYFLYNTKPDKMGSSEMSRYLIQLLYNEKYKIIRRTQTFDIVPVKIPEIAIKRSPEMNKVLEKYYDNTGSEYFLSPSAISSYIDCSLRFYFRYIAGLKEYEKPLEEIDPSMLGNILHEAMHRLYEPFQNNTLQKETLTDLIQDNNKIESILKDAIAKIYFKNVKIQDNDKIQGRNIIILGILEKFIRQIIETDIKIAPFKILGLENNIINTFEVSSKSGGIKVRIGGNIDRIDEVDDYIRIIDYKTGSVETKFKNFEELFSPVEGKKAKKEILQAFIYSLLFKRNGKTDKPVKPGLYTLRTIFGEQFRPDIYYDRESIIDISNIENTFEEYLLKILEEIFNPDNSFSQTSDLKKCNFCAYKIICHRDAE